LPRFFFTELDTTELTEELQHLHRANRLASAGLRDLIVRGAERTGGVTEIREAAAALGEDGGAASVVDALIKPSAEDLRWVLSAQPLSVPKRLVTVTSLISRASRDQIRTMLADDAVAKRALALLLRDLAASLDTLLKIATQAPLSPETFIGLVIKIIPLLDRRAASNLAERALEGLLPREDEGQPGAMGELMAAVSDGFNAARAFRLGLQRGVSGAIASRNLIACNASPPLVRRKFIDAVESMATALVDRDRMDISLQAADAAAGLLWDAHQGSRPAYLKASAALLPSLMRATGDPVSPLIAAAFPPVYSELHRESLPDFMSFVFIFLDWDKCKSARRTLIECFLRSDWRATDIALAAVRAEDGTRILKRLARQHGGDRAIALIERDLQSIPPPWREQVKVALQDLKSD